MSNDKKTAPQGAQPPAPQPTLGAPGSGSPAGGDEGATLATRDLQRVLDVKVRLCVELGRRQVSIADVLALAPGAVVEFAKSSDEPLDIRVNDQLIARGEPVVMGDRYGVRVTEVVSPNDRLRSSGVVREDAA